MSLPSGIWYESHKRRYRVRLYKNCVAYLKGYYDDLESALAALLELQDDLEAVPQLPRKRRGAAHMAPVPTATLAGTLMAIRQRQRFDPAILRRRKAA